MKIALVGSAGAGKDYLADFLVSTYGFTKIAWADSLKNYCNTIYPNLGFYNNHENKDKIVPETWNIKHETPRDIWQRISREKSKTDDRFFHKLTLVNINNIILNNDNIIVTDTRNDWEYEDLVQDGFIVIYVTRPNIPIFQGYDERIKKFVDKIDLKYINTGPGEEFLHFLENNGILSK